jgi:hypothetical protein
MKYNVDSMLDCGETKVEINGRWVEAKPINKIHNLMQAWGRIKSAYGVLTGKYDALEWTDQ